MSQDYTVAKELASLKEIKQSAEQRISELSLNALNYVNDHRLHKAGGSGGGDFTTAQVTITNSTNSNRAVFMPGCYEGEDDPDFQYPPTCIGYVPLRGNQVLTVTVPIYKNGAAVIVKGTSGDMAQGVVVATSFTVTGDAEDDGSEILVYGDCAVTIS